jgi:hypothetical protein
MMLFGLRFAAAAGNWLVPVTVAGWRLLRCRERDKRTCRIRFVRAVDLLHLNLNLAITTPWSGSLLFAGSVLIGLGYFFGSSGDAVQLVSRHPEAWKSYDITTDALASIMSVTGMAFVQAATAQRRTASFLVSGVLIATGIGIGVVTL